MSASRRHDGARGVEVDVARRALGVVGLQDRHQPLLAGLAGDDGAVDLVGGVVGELDQQQELREAVVLADQALVEPAPRDVEDLREEPGLGVAVV